MPAQKHMATWKLIVALFAALFIAYTMQSHGTSIIESAYAFDIERTPTHEVCSDHTGWLILSWLKKIGCYAWYFVDLTLKFPLTLLATVITIPMLVITVIPKLLIFILYEVFMTFTTIVIYIALWLVESSLSPTPGSIAHTFIYQEGMQNIIHSSLWIPVRDLVHIAFALVLLFGAIVTIIKADKEWITTYAPKLFIMIILVNFSWFFSRMMLDVGNVAAKASMSLATQPNCTGCQEIKDIVLYTPLVGDAIPGYRCPLLFICFRTGPPNNDDPADRMTAGLLDGFVRILDVEGETIPQRIGRLVGFEILTELYNGLMEHGWSGMFGVILRALIDFLTSVGRMAMRALVLIIAAIFYLGAVVTLYAIFLLRIPIIWLTMGFMPLAALLPVLPNIPGKDIIKKEIWDKFLIAVFLPAFVGLPMAAGFAILQAAKNAGVTNTMTANMPAIAGIFFGSFVTDAAQLLFVVLGIAILWFGVLGAFKAQQLVPALQATIVDGISGITKSGARVAGEFAASRMPLLPRRLAIPGVPPLGDIIKRKLASLAPGAIPPPAGGTGGGGGGGGAPKPTGPMPKKALTPETMKGLAGRTLDLGDGVRARVGDVGVDKKGTDVVSLTGADGTKYEAPIATLDHAKVLKEGAKGEIPAPSPTPTEEAVTPAGKAAEPAEGTPPEATGEGIAAAVERGAERGVIKGMGGKVAEEKETPPSATEGTKGVPAGGEAPEPTWANAWAGLKNSKIGTIASNTRSRIMGIPVLGSLLRGTGKLIGGAGNVGKSAMKEAFREKKGGLGSVVTGLQKGMKELGAIARAGNNAPLTQPISEALKDARRQQHIPKEDVDKFHSAAQTDTNLDRHLNDFLASDTNMEHHLGQILTTLRAMGHAKGSSLSVGEGNLPSLLEELFKKKLETGGRGFTGPGMGGVSTGNDMFRKVLVQLEKVEAERRRRSTPPPAPPPSAPPPSGTPSS